MCIEESKHTKISQSKLDDRTDLGRADDGEEQMGKRHAHSRLAQFFSDAQIISFDITMKRNRKPREMKKKVHSFVEMINGAMEERWSGNMSH